jgi:AraC-like DNA-binding protein/quercetin dioxygenase-like cupin family protein
MPSQMRAVREDHRVGGFRLTRVSYAPGTVLGEHTHAGAELDLVLSGELGESAAGTRLGASPGQVLVRPARHRHANHFDSGHTEVICVQVPGRRWRALDHRLGEALVTDCGTPTGRRLASRIVAGIGGEPFGTLALEAALLELLHSVSRAVAEARDERLAATAQRLIGDDPTLSTPELARALAADEAQLRTAFARRQGVSLDRYRLERRLEQAERLIAATMLPLARIAADVGFYDQAHMARAFRQYRGYCPSTLRARRRSPAGQPARPA